MGRRKKSLLCDPGSELYDCYYQEGERKKGEDNCVGWGGGVREKGIQDTRVIQGAIVNRTFTVRYIQKPIYLPVFINNFWPHLLCLLTVLCTVLQINLTQ